MIKKSYYILPFVGLLLITICYLAYSSINAGCYVQGAAIRVFDGEISLPTDIKIHTYPKSSSAFSIGKYSKGRWFFTDSNIIISFTQDENSLKFLNKYNNIEAKSIHGITVTKYGLYNSSNNNDIINQLNFSTSKFEKMLNKLFRGYVFRSFSKQSAVSFSNGQDNLVIISTHECVWETMLDSYGESINIKKQAK